MPRGVSAELLSPFAIENLIGQKAPDFSLPDLSGKSVALSSYRGKVIIVLFWASWCPPCKNELQSLNNLYRVYRNRGLIILAVASEQSSAAVSEFIERMPLEFDVLYDSNLIISKDVYKVFMMPTTFIIDRHGIISKKHFGEQDWTRAERVAEVESLLK
ncbi:MAG TPA: TlpA disulfide reductase family protein [Dissulfurispiraceae bacterium]|nr:TlpA disulfide reductase family protein [Dissulfurispiraceae bacterium]